MPDIDVNDLDSYGLVLDIPGFQLPPEAWTTAENVRFDSQGVEKGAMWASVLATAVAPYFVMGVRLNDISWFIYAGLTAVHAWNQVTDDDISDVAFTTTNGRDWNGCVLGGIPIISNNKEPPKYWPAISVGTNLATLSAWTAGLGANSYTRLIRPLGPYLVALRPTIAGTEHPHGVLWSHPADPGTLPASWDYTDPSKDAGLTELSDSESGPIVEAEILRNALVIYKEGSTHLMRIAGGDFIMQFDPLFASSGILAPRCAKLTGDGKYHFVATNDDIILHDGVSAKSLVDHKVRRRIFSSIDTSNYLNSFVFAHPTKREMWFCYPESGSATVTRALVWHYGSGDETGVVSEQVFPYVSATLGSVIATQETWAADTDTWDSTVDVWDVSVRRQVIVADPINSKLLQLDPGVLTRDGVSFTGTLARTGVSFLGKKRDNSPIVDFRNRKFIRRVWIKAQGQAFDVRVGVSASPDADPTWNVAQTFNPATMEYIDVRVSGRGAPAIEFSFNQDGVTELYGYTLEVQSAGRF